MIPTLVIMLLFAIALTVLAYLKDPSLPVAGLQDGGKMLLGIIPILVLAFVAAGMIGKVLPRELLTQWLGNESGFRGLAIATAAGSITPGGPFIQFPIVAALCRSFFKVWGLGNAHIRSMMTPFFSSLFSKVHFKVIISLSITSIVPFPRGPFNRPTSITFPTVLPSTLRTCSAR